MLAQKKLPPTLLGSESLHTPSRMASPSQVRPLVALVVSHQYLDSYQTHPSNIQVHILSAVSKQHTEKHELSTF